MKRFVLTKPAERDLEQIKTYLIEKTSPRVARHVMKTVRAALDLIGKRPDIGHVREDLTSGPVKFWPVYSYLIVYNPGTKPVQIVRVLHAKRDVEQILN